MNKPTPELRLVERERPQGRLAMRQNWRDLLFLHWQVAPETIARTLPHGLHVDIWEERAWIGIVPFYMEGVRPTWSPALPWLSKFNELNLRTYVYDNQGRPGVWFYSLDCTQPIAVEIARRFFHLPYFHARMQREVKDGWTHYHSTRRHSGRETRFTYRGTGEAKPAEPDTLEFFLAERYRLFSAKGNQLHSGQVHHPPYPLQSAEVAHWDTELFGLDHLPPPMGPPDHICYAKGVDVDIYPLKKLAKK